MSNKYLSIEKKCMDCIKSHNYDEAITFAHELLDLYEDDPSELKIYNVFKNIEKVYYNTPNAIMYVTYMQRLIDIFEREKRFEEMVKTMYFLAIDYVAIRNFDGAEIMLNDAMKIAKRINAYDVQADIINGYGNMFELRDENKKALESYLLAFNMSIENHYLEGTRFSHNVGFAYKKLGEYSKAIHYLKLCINFLNTVNMPGRLANAWNELGDTYKRSGNYKLAHEALNEGLEHSINSKSNAFLKENYLFQSELYEEEGNFKQALHYHKKLSKLSEIINIDRHKSEVINLQNQCKVNSIEVENEIIKQKNKELEAYSRALDKSNKSLLESIAETNAMQRKVIQSEKNSSYNRMMIGVAHKVNTSIANINLMTSLIQQEISAFRKKLDAQTVSKNDLNNCLQSTCEGMELINNSSNKVAKFIESVKRVSISIDEMNVSGSFRQLLDECVDDNQTLIREYECKVNIRLQDDLPVITGFNIFKRIINELFNNALKYAFIDKKNNTIDIKIHYNKSGRIVILFKDNGKGIPKEDVIKIFDPFFTSNMGSKGGAGMGLYILQKTVSEILCGEITCVSSEGQGTEFIIELTNQFVPLFVGS
ncbi:MAG: tetratricopeptide repeat-containing sensor histidine kinase [Clostridiales bacterium]|nr:tetratricopeptide repeat-containing sensor histidine kinase [Clostridiales bacterium]